MPRSIAFDPEEILDRAMDVFWEKGFEATSLPDIERATGLNRSSLYNTFGSMRDVYYAALDGYRRTTTAAMHDTLGAGPAPYALRAYFDLVVEETRGEHGRRGASSPTPLSNCRPPTPRRPAGRARASRASGPRSGRPSSGASAKVTSPPTATRARWRPSS